MRVFISYIQGAYLRDYEKSYIPLFSEEIRRHGAGEFTIVDDPAQADAVIMWEGFEYKTPSYVGLLENDPLIRAHAERIYSINYDDHPEGFLAGVYTSLEAPFFNPTLHRIWPFYQMNNPRVYDLTREDVMRCEPKYLFSFTGAASHEVRKQLFKLYDQPGPDYHIEHVRKWYNHDDKDRLKFARVALETLFCLCPHGYCAYTPRITEVMSMARVPVIIADDWIPISFPENLPYYIKVPEKDIAHLRDILSARKGEAEKLRHNARLLWERHCAPQHRAPAVLRCIAALQQQNRSPLSYAAYRERWHSKSLLKNLGWTRPQQFALRVEQRVRRWLPTAKIPGVSKLMRYRNAPNLK